ncbi:unnamed protein product, partial [Amoebophrya sp. A25]|eukprot:GSA25T00007832001.1
MTRRNLSHKSSLEHDFGDFLALEPRFSKSLDLSPDHTFNKTASLGTVSRFDGLTSEMLHARVNFE